MITTSLVDPALSCFDDNEAYQACLVAHPYYLSTIRLWIPPAGRMSLAAPLSHQDILRLNSLALTNSAEARRMMSALEPSLRQSGLSDVADAMEAVIALHHKEYQTAIKFAEIAVIQQPDVAEYYYLIGVIAAQARDVPLCVGACRRAIALRPDYGLPLAALALIYTLNQNWHEALIMARQAKIHTANKIYFIDLCLLASCWSLGLPNESTLLFDTLTDGTKNKTDFFDWLPPVTWPPSTTGIDTARQVFFVYGDLNYLPEHIVPLVWSLAEAKAENVHLHIHIAANPHPFLLTIFEALRQRSGLSLSWSIEHVDPFSYGNLKIYHSCVRFCRFTQFVEFINRPAYSLDADSLFYRSPKDMGLFDNENLDLAIEYRSGNPLWETCLGAGLFVRPTSVGMQYLKMASRFILHNIGSSGIFGVI